MARALNADDLDDDGVETKAASAPKTVPVEDREGILVQRYFKDFLLSAPKYAEQVALMKEREKSTLYVLHKDIASFRNELADAITDDYLRYKPVLEKAVYAFVQQVVRWLLAKRSR
jgi:hypothetical protein